MTIAMVCGAPWCACSASDTATHAPERDDWTASVHYETAAMDAGTEDASTSMASSTVDAAPRPDAFVRAPGWYCIEIRAYVRSENHTSECHKTAQSCEKSRDLFWEVGKHTSECAFQPTAFCFHVENETERYDSLLCADAMKECTDLRAQIIKYRDPATTTYTECTEYD